MNLQGNLPNPGIEPTSPALQADALPSESPGKLKVGSVLVGQSCLTLCVTRPVIHQVPLFMGFFRQEYWSGLPFPSPGDLPNPGIEPTSPALQADALPSEPPGKPFTLNLPKLLSLHITTIPINSYFALITDHDT